jgi:hypothetical protein
MFKNLSIFCGIWVLHSMLQMLVTIYVVPSSVILSTPMMEALHFSETPVLRRATWCHITEDGILQFYFGLFLFCAFLLLHLADPHM